MENNAYIASRLEGTDYSGNDTALFRNEVKKKQDESYVVNTRLANGSIVGESLIKRDDGATVESRIVLGVYAVGRYLGQIEIPQQDFETKLMQYLPLEFRPTVGGNSKAYIADSIRAQADKMKQLTIYQHTGWRIIDGTVAFLHNGGAIGKEGVTVELEGKSSQFMFTTDSHNDRWETFKKYLSVAPHTVTYPLLAISALSPLNEFLRKARCEPSFLLFLLGRTGSGKSTLAALTLCFFGEFGNKGLPASSKDTVNALEKMGFLTKDILTVIDDFRPSTSQSERSRLAYTTQELCRAYGDRTGKNRMNADGSMRASYPPRGNAILTGEDIPVIGESGEARFLIVEVIKSEVNMQLVQDVDSKHIHLNECMRDYITWLIPLYEKLPDTLNKRFLELRTKAQSGGHGRIAESIAHLQLAIEVWCLFMRSADLISETEATDMKEEAWVIFRDLADKNNKALIAEKPSVQFLSALRELLLTGKVKLFPTDTSLMGSEGIGWKDGNYAYLNWGTAYNAVCKYYRERDGVFPLGTNQLLKHLAAEHYIVSDKDNNSKLKKLGGKTRRVVWLHIDALDEKDEQKEEK